MALTMMLTHQSWPSRLLESQHLRKQQNLLVLFCWNQLCRLKLLPLKISWVMSSATSIVVVVKSWPWMSGQVPGLLRQQCHCQRCSATSEIFAAGHKVARATACNLIRMPKFHKRYRKKSLRRFAASKTATTRAKIRNNY